MSISRAIFAVLRVFFDVDAAVVSQNLRIPVIVMGHSSRR